MFGFDETDTTIEEMVDIGFLLEEKSSNTFKSIKPLKNKGAVKSFCSKNHVSLDKETEEFLISNNGGRPSKNTIKVKGTERVMNSLLSFSEDDKDNVYKAKKRVEEDDSYLVPFAKDPAGNYFCFKGKQVVFYDHEDGEQYRVSGSFMQFINSLK